MASNLSLQDNDTLKTLLDQKTITQEQYDKAIMEKSMNAIGPTDTAAQLLDIYKDTNPPDTTVLVPEGLEDIIGLKYDEEYNPYFELKKDFGEMKPTGWGADQADTLEDILNVLPANSPYIDLLRRKMDLAREEQQISSSDYLINLFKNQNNLGLTGINTLPGIQVASVGDLSNLGIGNLIEQQRVRAENQADGSNVSGAVGMSGSPSGTGQTGGTTLGSSVHGTGTYQPMTQSTAQSSPIPRGPNLTNRAQGGLVSINDLIRRM